MMLRINGFRFYCLYDKVKTQLGIRKPKIRKQELSLLMWIWEISQPWWSVVCWLLKVIYKFFFFFFIYGKTQPRGKASCFRSSAKSSVVRLKFTCPDPVFHGFIHSFALQGRVSGETKLAWLGSLLDMQAV